MRERLSALQARAHDPARSPQEVLEQSLAELETTYEELRVSEEELRRQQEMLIASQEALAQQSQRYQDLFEFAPDGYLVTDVYGSIQEANHAAVRFLGVQSRYLVGKPLINFIPRSERKAFRAELLRLTTKEPASDWEVILQPRRGVPFEAALTVTILRDKQRAPEALRWLVRDISPRQQALRASEERFRLLIDSLHDYAVFMLDTQGRITSWNHAAERILGYTEAEIMGQDAAIIFTPEDRAKDAPEQELRTARTHGSAEDERWHLKKDGSRFWGSGILTMLRAGRADFQGFAKILRDMTERKEAQETRERDQAQIEALNDLLRRAMTETHHRVKNNLQVIAAMVDMRVLEGQATVPLHELQRLSTHIRTLALLHDLLTQETREDRLAQSLSTKPLLESMMALLKQTAASSRLTYTIADVRLPVAHASALALIANELVSNGFKHGNTQVEVQFLREGGQVLLEVCDDGPGFPIGFDAQRAANTGLELVLTLTRHDLRGEIVFVNRAEGGACVQVTLPLPL